MLEYLPMHIFKIGVGVSFGLAFIIVATPVFAGTQTCKPFVFYVQKKGAILCGLKVVSREQSKEATQPDKKKIVVKKIKFLGEKIVTGKLILSTYGGDYLLSPSRSSFKQLPREKNIQQKKYFIVIGNVVDKNLKKFNLEKRNGDTLTVRLNDIMYWKPHYFPLAGVGPLTAQVIEVDGKALNPISKTGWITTTNQQLGIRFEHPADASVSSEAQRQTTDGTTISELTVTPAGMDPTRVHFFSTNTSLDQAKNIQIYGFTNVKNSEFTNATIDGRAGTRRIDHYLNNDCTNELTVVEKNEVIYGFHVVQCPTHSEGYDQLRKDIASSLKLL